MEIILIFMACVILILLFIVFRRTPSDQNRSNDQTAALLGQQIEAIRSDMRSSLQEVRENVTTQLASVTAQLQTHTANVTQQLQAQTADVGSRLENAARVIGDVQKNLGELGEATREIKEVGENVSKLEELLRAPKIRGGLGEFLLEELLKQVLPAGHFEMQYHFKGGQAVDAIVRTSDGIVSVDSKFPLENFRKMISAESDADKKIHQKAFQNDVKKHIDSIAAKYILPDEGTFPFALMYIPAENIYYEVIIKDEGLADTGGIYNYAIYKKVIPVSPNSLYAYLQVVAVGLKGMYIEQSARQILNSLSGLSTDISKVREVFDVLGSHLENARKKYDEADKRLTNFVSRLENVGDHTLADEKVKQLLD